MPTTGAGDDFVDALAVVVVNAAASVVVVIVDADGAAAVSDGATAPGIIARNTSDNVDNSDESSTLADWGADEPLTVCTSAVQVHFIYFEWESIWLDFEMIRSSLCSLVVLVFCVNGFTECAQCR